MIGNYIKKGGILIGLSCCLLMQLYSKDATIDSLKQILSTTNSDSIKYDLCKRIGDGYYEINLDSTVAYYQQAITVAQRLQDTRGVISTLRSLGYTYSNRSSNYEVANDYFQQAVEIAENNKDTIGLTYLLSDLGVLFWSKGASINAADYHFKAYQLAQQLKHPRLIMKTSMSLGVLYNEEKDNRKAIKFYKSAIPIADSLGRKRVKGVLFNNIGKALRDSEEFDSAAVYFKNALAIFNELDDNDWKSLVYYNIAKNNHEIGEYKEAIYQYQSALNLNQIIDNKSRASMILTGLAETYVLQKNYSTAIQTAEKGLTILDDIDTKLYRKDLNKVLAVSYEAQGNYKLAYVAFQNHLTAKDSLQEEEKSNKIAQYTQLYESEKKKVEIAELKIENASKEMQLNYSNNIIRLLGIGFLLLLAFICAWYYYLKNKSLEQYKQLRVQLTHDLHDNINSSLNHIKIIAGRLSRDTYSVSEKKYNLQRIRTISQDLVHNMHDLIWALDDKKIKLVDLLDKMEDYVSNVFSSLKAPYFIDNTVEASGIVLKTDTKNNIYAIYKEAINNIIKHTHPTNVEIYFSLINNQFQMKIKNDIMQGKDVKSTSRIGLKSIQKRTKAIKGTLNIEEKKGTFIVTLTVPV